MNLGDAIHIWNISCHPPIGIAEEEEVCAPTALMGAAMALEVPTFISFSQTPHSTDERKKIADFLRKWADDIEGAKTDAV